jgi:MFS family permease
MSTDELPFISPASAPATRTLDRRFVTAALMLVMVLASMEQTVTSTAMPTIIGELHGLEHYSWVASIYLLACTVSMPLYGRLADALGRKRVVIFAIALFCGASLLASTAHTMIQLVIYRGFQGLGAGGIMPIVLTIQGDVFTLEERARIQGFFSAVWGCAALAGPALGAYMVKFFGWRSIFFVNLPFGMIGLLVLIWKYHDVEKPHSTDLDLPGAATLAIGCISILALVSRLGPGGWSYSTGIALLAIALAALIYYRIHERHAANPIFPVEFLASRAIGPPILCSLLIGAAFLSLDTYVPLYVQGGRGGGATAAAGVVTPVMLTWATSGIFAAPMVVRFGFRKTSLLGATLVILGFAGLLACAIAEAPRWVITTVLALTGFGFGPCSMSYLMAAQDAVTWQQRGIATSSIQFFRTIGGAIGIGVLGALFNVLIRPEMSKLQAQGVQPATLLDAHLSAQLSPDVIQFAQHMISSGLKWVFAAMLIFAIVQFILTLFMPSKRADHPISAAEAFEAIA